MDLSILPHPSPLGLAQSQHRQPHLLADQKQFHETQLQQDSSKNGTNDTPTLALVWQAKSDGTSVTLMNPEDINQHMENFFLVKPGVEGNINNNVVMAGKSQRTGMAPMGAEGTYDEDNGSNSRPGNGTQHIVPNNMGGSVNANGGYMMAPPRANSLPQPTTAAYSAYSNIAPDIRDAGTYTPARSATFEGLNASVWSNNYENYKYQLQHHHNHHQQHQLQSPNPYRSGFGGYIPRTYRTTIPPPIQTTREAHQGWLGGEEEMYGETLSPLALSPPSSPPPPGLGVHSSMMPTASNPVPKPSYTVVSPKNKPQFEAWCRDRLNFNSVPAEGELTSNAPQTATNMDNISPTPETVQEQNSTVPKNTQATIDVPTTDTKPIAEQQNSISSNVQVEQQPKSPSTTQGTKGHNSHATSPVTQAQKSPKHEKVIVVSAISRPSPLPDKPKTEIVVGREHWKADAKAKGAIRQGLDNLALAAPMAPPKTPRAVIVKGRSDIMKQVCRAPSALPSGGTSSLGMHLSGQQPPQAAGHSDAAQAAPKPAASAGAGAPQAESGESKPVTILARRGVSFTQPAPDLPQDPSAPRPPGAPRQSPPPHPQLSGSPPHGIPSPDSAIYDNPYDPPRPRGIKKFCTYWFRTRKCDFYWQQGCAYSHDIYAYVRETFPEKLALYTSKYKISAEKMTEQEMWDVMDLKIERAKEYPPPDREIELGSAKWRLKKEFMSRPINVTITAAPTAEVLGAAKKKKESSGKGLGGNGSPGGSKKGAPAARGGKASSAHTSGGGKGKSPQSITIRASSVKVSDGPPKRTGSGSGKRTNAAAASTTTKVKGRKGTASADENEDDVEDDFDDEENGSAAQRKDDGRALALAKESIDDAGFLKNNMPMPPISTTTAPATIPTGPTNTGQTPTAPAALSKRQPVPINSQPWKNVKKQIAEAAGFGVGKVPKTSGPANTKPKAKREEDLILPGIESRTGMKVEVGGGDETKKPKEDLLIDLGDEK
ncbi:hypothetical protein DFH27DRAFT_534706 [Peziza echinospora]|nr:hypothetical protein DFH27DRAFT_534706 [Peziza echinospora]